MAQRFMLGSEKKADYLVIGKAGRVVLGFKALAECPSGVPGVFLGGRIRSAYDPDYTAPEGTSAVKVPGELAKAWPGIDFQNSSPERASSMIGTMAPYQLPEQKTELLSDMAKEEIVTKMASWLLALVPEPNREITQDELAQFITEAYAKEIALLASFNAHHQGKEEDTNVVSLQAAAIKKAAQHPEPGPDDKIH